jgi:hypothetical protein
MPQPEQAAPIQVPQTSVQAASKQAGFAQSAPAAQTTDAHGVRDTTMPRKTDPAAINGAPAATTNEPASAPAKSSHAQRRHIAKAHVNEASAASEEQPVKSSAPPRAGGNEVQLF